MNAKLEKAWRTVQFYTNQLKNENVKPNYIVIFEAYAMNGARDIDRFFEQQTKAQIKKNAKKLVALRRQLKATENAFFDAYYSDDFSDTDRNRLYNDDGDVRLAIEQIRRF